MQELLQQIPDVSLFLELAPEELGAKILFLMRARSSRQEYQFGFLLSALEAELWPQTFGGQRRTYPLNKRDEVGLALTEAWAWLEAQGLLVPANGTNGQIGRRVLSRRARAMASEAEFANFKIARLLPKEVLHPQIANRVWGAFVRGEFDSAAFQAMKAVEVAVRDAAGFGNEEYGTGLMEKAFSTKGGPLTDMSVEENERRGRMFLFAGVYQSYRNPQAHRDVNLDDPLEALEIIYLANHLLRIVDARARARTQGP